MRKPFAVGASIVCGLLTYFGLREVADSLGLPFYWWADEALLMIGGGGRYVHEYESSSGWSDFGVYALIVSSMVAWRLFHWINAGKPDGNLPLEKRSTWFVWLLGLSLYAVGLALYVLLDLPDGGLAMAKMALIGGAYFVSSRLHHRLVPLRVPSVG